jgi:hypothetical protein
LHTPIELAVLIGHTALLAINDHGELGPRASRRCGDGFSVASSRGGAFHFLEFFRWDHLARAENAFEFFPGHKAIFGDFGHGRVRGNFEDSDLTTGA